MKKQQPDLHQNAVNLKNRRRLRMDGGRAWIKNGQLHDAVNNGALAVERNPKTADK